jgi:hypothetical protein
LLRKFKVTSHLIKLVINAVLFSEPKWKEKEGGGGDRIVAAYIKQKEQKKQDRRNKSIRQGP